MIEDLKPYSDFKPTGLPWLEGIPAHWDLVPNRALVRRRKQLVGRSHHRYTLLSLTKKGIIVRDVAAGKGKFSSDMGTSQEVREGDLVFCFFDVPETPRTVGLSSHHGMITGAYTVLEPLQPGIAPYFELFYQAMDDSKLLSPLYSGLRNTIPVDRFLGTKTPVPPPQEQAAIVRFLDHANRRIDQFIRSKKKLIALLNEQKQAIIHRAVTRGLDSSVKLKDSGVPWLGVVPAHWEIRPLKGMAAVQSGITLGKDYGTSELVEYPYVRVANVQAGRLALDRITTVRVPTAEAVRSLLRAGDVLMTEGGDADKLGRGCVWQAEISPCLHQNHVFAVRPYQQLLLPFFLQTVLAAPYSREYFIRTAKQTTNLAATNKTTVGNHRVATPPLEEQKTILAALAEQLSPIDAALSMAGKDIGLMYEYRTRLISDVVTGQLDVRAAAASLPDLETDAASTEPEGDDEDADIEDSEAA